MATTLDFLTAPEFSDDRLTEVINIPDYKTGRPAQLGIFRDVPIATTYVRLGVSEDEVAIIPSRERGGEHNANMRGDKAQVMVSVPHFPLDDAIHPSDIQNIIGWGESAAYRMVGDVYNEKLLQMRAKHDATHHHLDWGALRGKIVDAEGYEIADLYSLFGITQTTTNIALGTAGTDVMAGLRAVRTGIQREMKGATYSGLRIFAGADWFNAYIGHASIKEALKYYAAPGQLNPARDDVLTVFSFGGVTVELVDEEFAHRKADGTFEMLPAVEADEAIAVPLGTPYFRRYIAPPDSINLANVAPSTKIFVATNELPYGKGREIHSESNILPICTRPQIITKLTMS